MLSRIMLHQPRCLGSDIYIILEYNSKDSCASGQPWYDATCTRTLSGVTCQFDAAAATPRPCSPQLPIHFLFITHTRILLLQYADIVHRILYLYTHCVYIAQRCPSPPPPFLGGRVKSESVSLSPWAIAPGCWPKSPGRESSGREPARLSRPPASAAARPLPACQPRVPAWGHCNTLRYAVRKRSVLLFIFWLTGWLIGSLIVIEWLIGRLIDWLIGWFDWMVWLIGWFNWSVDWDWLV